MYNCLHCIQKNIKLQVKNELSTEELKTAILHSKECGLCSLGINFTGGEVLGNRHDIFEILEYTQSLGIKYRLNTNSWWATRSNFIIGNQHFNTAKDLAAYIKSLGIELFAFSCDIRHKSIENQKSLFASIKICEELQIKYQLIFTGLNLETIYDIIEVINNNCGKLNYLIPVSMQMVDIGGGTNVNNNTYIKQSNKSYCNKKGFLRPTTLHVSPDGNVRTCMYAVGLNNCGNLREMNMMEIINNFEKRINQNIFSDPEKFNKFEKENVIPYQHYYNSIIHECKRFSIIALTAEMIEKHPYMSLDEIHNKISRIL